jgi:hypothetical protein
MVVRQAGRSRGVATALSPQMAATGMLLAKKVGIGFDAPGI